MSSKLMMELLKGLKHIFKDLNTGKITPEGLANPYITTGDAIVNAAQKLTSALRGSIPPPLVKSGIDHLRALTDIFNATKESYDEREK